jgi:hypothetical protein
MKEWPFDEIMRPTTFEMAQEGHADGVPGDDEAVLTVRRCNGGTSPDDEYIAIRLTGEWAFDGVEDIDAFCAKLKSTLPNPDTQR